MSWMSWKLGAVHNAERPRNTSIKAGERKPAACTRACRCDRMSAGINIFL